MSDLTSKERLLELADALEGQAHDDDVSVCIPDFEDAASALRAYAASLGPPSEATGDRCKCGRVEVYCHYHVLADGTSHGKEQCITHEPKVGRSVILNGYQLRAALQFVAPDDDAEQLETEVHIQHGAGHSGEGYYCALYEYPEEGSFLLDPSAPVTKAETP